VSAPGFVFRLSDNSDGGSAQGAVYEGATSADLNGSTYLYDSTFKRVYPSGDVFDPQDRGDYGHDDHGEEIPQGYAPFNVQNIGGTLFVTYAKQNAPRHDPVGGASSGFVELFTPAGKHIGHLQHGTG
jgi:hypothetical protein